ncbi:hypothetical protein [Vibrio sp.]|uniref:hypothetical protein n=1 Tax=Vibrio sp. TaxID=678 RepID=UPI003AA84E9F
MKTHDNGLRSTGLFSNMMTTISCNHVRCIEIIRVIFITAATARNVRNLHSAELQKSYPLKGSQEVSYAKNYLDSTFALM